MTQASHFILFVADQARSGTFYASILGSKPSLDAPGMTEIRTPWWCCSGADAQRRHPPSARLHPAGPRPDPGHSRVELYLMLEDPETHHSRALAAGARELSPMLRRDWGHRAAYSLDQDGHVRVSAEDAEKAGAAD